MRRVVRKYSSDHSHKWGGTKRIKKVKIIPKTSNNDNNSFKTDALAQEAASERLLNPFLVSNK